MSQPYKTERSQDRQDFEKVAKKVVLCHGFSVPLHTYGEHVDYDEYQHRDKKDDYWFSDVQTAWLCYQSGLERGHNKKRPYNRKIKTESLKENQK
jgi:hypothetical protein